MARVLIGILILTSFSQVASAAPCGPGYPPGMECQTLAEVVVNSLKTLGDMAALKAQLTVQLEQARRRFFATYPNGPGHAQAQKEFLHLLDEKDLWYLYIQAYFAPTLKVKSGGKLLSDWEVAIYLDKIFGLGISVDGGIRAFAIFQFDDWSDAIKRNSSGFVPTAFAQLGNANAKIWHETEEPYRRYWLARSWAEFAAAGRNLTDDPGIWLRLLFMITRPLNGLGSGQTQMGYADRFYSTLTAAFGEEAVLRAARRVMAAPKSQDAKVTLAAGQDPLKPYQAFGKALGETSDRNFGLMHATEWDDPFDGEQRLPRVEATYARLDAIYGEQTVAELVTKLRREIEVQPLDGDGKRISIPHQVERRLQAKDTRYFVRAILAEHDRLNTRAAVDAAYNRLAQGRGEKAVIAAGDEILEFLKIPYTSVAPEWKRMDYRGPGNAYGWLTGIVAGTLKLPRPQAADLAENPDYVAWSKCPVGTTVVYGRKEWAVKDGKLVVNNMTHDPFNYSLELRKLHSRDDEVAYVTILKRYFQVTKTFPPAVGGLQLLHRMDPTQLKEATGKRMSGTKLIGESSGQETLEVNGKTYRTLRTRTVTGTLSGAQVFDIVTRWTSDEVPGLLVRERLERTYGGPVTWFSDLAIQHFTVDDLATFPGISMELLAIKPELPLNSSEVTHIARKMLAPSLPAGANLGKLMEGQTMVVTTLEAMNLAAVDAGKTFSARLESPLLYRGQVLVESGAEVHLKARREFNRHLATSVDSVVLDGTPIVVVTNEARAMLRLKPLPADAPGAGQGRRQPQTLAQQQERLEIPPGMRLTYLILPGRN